MGWTILSAPWHHSFSTDLRRSNNFPSPSLTRAMVFTCWSKNLSYDRSQDRFPGWYQSRTAPLHTLVSRSLHGITRDSYQHRIRPRSRRNRCVFFSRSVSDAHLVTACRTASFPAVLSSFRHTSTAFLFQVSGSPSLPSSFPGVTFRSSTHLPRAKARLLALRSPPSPSPASRAIRHVLPSKLTPCINLGRCWALQRSRYAHRYDV